MEEDEVQLIDGEEPEIELDDKQKMRKLSDAIDELRKLFEQFDTNAKKFNNFIHFGRIILCFTDMVPELFFVQGLISTACITLENFRRKRLIQPEKSIFKQIEYFHNVYSDVKEKSKNKSWLQYILYPFKALYRLFRKESPLKKSVGKFEAEAKAIRQHRRCIHTLSLICSSIAFVFCILLYKMSDMERKSRVINGVALLITFAFDFSIASFRTKGESFLEGLQSLKNGLEQRELHKNDNHQQAELFEQGFRNRL